MSGRRSDFDFWATHSGAELDLLVVQGRRRLGFEFKRTTTPAITRSMRTAADALGLAELCVVHAGRESGQLAKGIRAVAFDRLSTDVTPLR